MRALICREFGPPEALVLEDTDTPIAGEGQLLVDLYAAGINYPDILIFAGKYQVRFEPPFVPGYEAAGVVTAVGDGVTKYSPGDKVIVIPMPQGGAFAEQIVIDENQAYPLPESLSFEQGAGFPITFCTSYHALKDCAALKAGETVLVLGAAGGVGTTAVEIAKAMGARVIAAASTVEKLEFARSAGADDCINYSNEPLKESVREITGGRGVDVVYDPVGGDLAEQALRSAAWHGRHLVVGFASGEIPRLPVNLTLLKEASIVGVFWGQWAALNPQSHLQNMREMVEMLSAGKLNSRITEAYDLADYVRAYDDVANRRIRGKTVFRLR